MSTLTLAELRTRLDAADYEPHNSSRAYTTLDELRFNRTIQQKGRRIVLLTLREYVNSRRWDKGVDVVAVRMALDAALSEEIVTL